MSKFDTVACLRARHGAVGVIKNIRRVRNLLRTQPFDEKLFDKINGSDSALEGLVGRQILFPVLDSAERHQLKHDINAALFMQESKAYESLRQTLTDFFKRVKDAERSFAPVQADALKRLELTSNEALDAYDEQKVEAGALTLERCVSTLEQMEMVAQQVEDLIPSFQIFLEADEDGLNEEANEDENHAERNGEPEEGEGETSEGDEDDDEEEDEDLPDETDEEEEDEDDDDDEEGEEEDDEHWFEELTEFTASADHFVTTESKTLRELGGTTARAREILMKRDEVAARYNKVLRDLMDLVEPETCTSESLLRGSTKVFRKIDRVIEAVESLEHLRAAMDKTCDAVVAATRPMFLAATTKK